MDDNEFIKKYDSHIKSFAYKYCRDRKNLKDFQQNLRVRLWQAYKSHYDPAKGKLSTWVYQTLQLHARKLRFDTLKQEIFEGAVLGSDYYHDNYYIKDPYFLGIACLVNTQKIKSETLYPELEHRIELSLTPEERAVYNLIMRDGPQFKVTKISKELKISKLEVERIHRIVKQKVTKIFSDLYGT